MTPFWTNVLDAYIGAVLLASLAVIVRGVVRGWRARHQYDQEQSIDEESRALDGISEKRAAYQKTLRELDRHSGRELH
jgi:hypothetical protein